jgi:hypothetical protein
MRKSKGVSAELRSKINMPIGGAEKEGRVEKKT